jgi:hypothetical protein
MPVLGMMIWSALLGLISPASVPMHKFYVSKTTIELNPVSGMFEVTCKIFTDDLERAIGSTDDNPVRLGTERESADAAGKIESYLKQKLKVKLNNQMIELRYVGKESEVDLTYCYFEFYGVPDFTTLEVTNDILFDHFADQQNIVDFVAFSKTRTAVLLINQPSHLFYR